MKTFPAIKRPLIALPLILTVTLLGACGSDDAPTELKKEPVQTIAEISLVAACSGCHGNDGVSSKPDTPFIAGQTSVYLEIAMRSYLSGERKEKVMRQAVMELSVEERMELANYYSMLETPWSGGMQQTVVENAQQKLPVVTQSSINAGKALSKPCESCHGADGNSVRAGVPSIAGLQPAYFIPSLKAYLSGERRGAAIMKNFKLSLSENDIRNLAAYFSVQQRNRSPLTEKLQKTVPSEALAPRCVGCHGVNGNSTHPAMPSLAGQNASYLIKAMQAYRDGERSNNMMVAVAKGLSDQDIAGNATFFATRSPEKARSLNTAKTNVTQFDPMSDAMRLASSCNACHGNQGNNPTTGAPRLSGLSVGYLRDAINAYREGRRKNAEMAVLTEFLSDIEIEKLGLYYASQDPEQSSDRLEGVDTGNGSELSASCSGCHGKEGNSSDPKVPSLAGQSATYLLSAIKSYKDHGGRNHEDMKNAVQDLDDKSIKQLAQYYAQLTPVSAKPRLPESPTVMLEKCDRCHGGSGASPDPGKPRIAGQRRSYIVSSLLAYKYGTRTNSMMRAMAKDLWLVEIEAIATHYASVK